MISIDDNADGLNDDDIDTIVRTIMIMLQLSSCECDSPSSIHRHGRQLRTTICMVRYIAARRVR